MFCQKDTAKAEVQIKAEIQKSNTPGSPCLTQELAKVKSRGKPIFPNSECISKFFRRCDILF